LLFTRTIRRKLLCGLMLVLCMLLTASLSGIWGLSSFDDLIGELEFSLRKAPDKNELVFTVGELYGPLIVAPPEEQDELQIQQFRLFQLELLREQLELTKKSYRGFQYKLDNMPTTPVSESQFPLINGSLRQFYAQLTDLEAATSAAMHSAHIDAAMMQKLLERAWEVNRTVREMRDPTDGLSAALQKARRDYSTTFSLLWSTTAVAVALFLGLIRYGYVQIFQPLRELHEGARRVAQGRFEHRISIRSQDEMGELAESFNMMTARFQDIADDLDRQVDERSRQLVRSERLAAVGFLSAGVAHEINNPLAAISMASESIEERMEELLGDRQEADADVVRDYLHMIQRESFRCREITTKLLDFSRGSESAREQTDVTSLIGEVIAMVQHLSKYQEMKIEFAPSGASYLEANPAELKQVFLNLVANGLESMETGGTLSIDLEERTDEVLVLFRDEGCGMSSEVIEHLFEPFFTSKRVGKGTGLGLSISHRIINDHGGTIEARSDGVGQGSTFCIRLPKRCVAQAAA